MDTNSKKRSKTVKKVSNHNSQQNSKRIENTSAKQPSIKMEQIEVNKSDANNQATQI